MAEYELVREIQNSCDGNQMRDVFFDEIETDDPEGYARALLGDGLEELTVERSDDGDVAMYARSGGLRQKLLFTRL